MHDYQDYGFTENKPFSAAYLEQSVLKMLDQAQNRVILDLGCGNGWLSRRLLQAGYEVYGIDASPSGIAVASSRHSGRFFLQDLRSQTLPEPIQHIPFDTIVSTEVIEHLYDPLAFLDFCARILRQRAGGQLLLSTPYHGYLKNLAISLLGGWDHHFMALQKGEHIKFWSRKSLSEALALSGFEVEAFAGSGRLPYLWKSMLIKASIQP